MTHHAAICCNYFIPVFSLNLQMFIGTVECQTFGAEFLESKVTMATKPEPSYGIQSNT